MQGMILMLVMVITRHEGDSCHVGDDLHAGDGHHVGDGRHAGSWSSRW